MWAEITASLKPGPLTLNMTDLMIIRGPSTRTVLS